MRASGGEEEGEAQVEGQAQVLIQMDAGDR